MVITNDELRLRKLFYRRTFFIILFVLASLIGVLLRLYWLQLINHEHYQTLSIDNRIKLLPLPPRRGKIIDRNNRILAKNTPSVDLFVRPDRVKDISTTIRALRKIVEISETDISRFKKQQRHRRRFEQVMLKSNLTQEEMAKFAVVRHRFPGVDLGVNHTRQYPYAELTAHVVGYIGRINENELNRIDTANYSGTSHIGKTGLEKYYEQPLHGTVGVQRVEMNASGQIIRVLETQPPVNGKNIRLHFDIDLQKTVMEALGDYNGSVVVIDIETGGVLAMVSKPSFDANLFVSGMSHSTYNKLNTDQNKPLYNRSTKGQYPPGSTVKPFIALAGLEHQIVDEDDSVFCPGHFKLKNTRRIFRDWKRSGHGVVNLRRSLEESCDVYYYDLAHTMGIEAMGAYLSQFDFGKQTGIDLPGETDANLPTKEWKQKRFKQHWMPGDTVNAGIGQGFFLASPLQLAHATAILAAKGKKHSPRLVSSIDGIPTSTDNPVQIPIKNTAHWKAVLKGMLAVVEGKHGTAHRIMSRDYRIAGKTGTAQVFTLRKGEEYDEKKLSREKHDHALFIALAPADNPKIAIAVIVEHGGHGSTTAAPVARQVMDAWFGMTTAAKEDEGSQDG